ncbi:hypothetical protein ACE10X_13160 [Bradyrhizobium sp. Pha-3]|uniref:hypothetical protein n=1 Tax=Bradyrhizobium sp. Pha-3 TaxID=208375 RepID=UPI0035D52678
MKTCGECKFYGTELEHEGQKYGFCYRYPPTPLAENKSTAAIVKPELRECGEFKPAPKRPAKAKTRK